jgi:DNA mismatch repair ATPase MutS
VLIVDGERPSRRIARLQKFIAARDALRNEFARPFAMLLLVRIQSAVAIDRWHATYRHALAAWLTAIGEMEALASLATFSFEHPADPFPLLRSDGPVVEATALAHPLIGSAMAVPNDLRLGQRAPHVLIVSGSNMSGKSTLLRATGVNVVLALAGGTVRAAQMSVSRVAIGATIRVEDSLQEGRSKFYAEILRISGIVRLSREDVPVLFLLDEILHGTNSFDRRIGAEAIVKSLVGFGAIGLVTTHDLALTELAASLGDKAANVHFEDRIEDGKMIFDYRMRDGVVEHSNALALMRAIGIDV